MIEEAYNATMNMTTMYGAFLNTVAHEIGWEQAIDLMSKTDEALGASMGKTTKEQMGIKDLDVGTASSIMKGMGATYGITAELEEGPNTVLVKNYKCPFYDGLKMSGFDHEAIEVFCRNGPATMVNAFVGQLDPTAKYQLRKFRSTQDDSCEEEIVLKK